MYHRKPGQISPTSHPAQQKLQQSSKTTAPQVKETHRATLIQRAKAEPSSLSADEVLSLQSAIGNREVSRLLAGRSATKVQAKLTIGEPGDKYEQEADRVASQVVEQLHAPDSAQSAQGKSVQRQDIEDEELQAKPEITALQRQDIEDEELQAKPSISGLQRVPLSPEVQREAMLEDDDLQAKSILQRQEAIDGGDASTDLESAINRARGSGQPLDAGLQQSMGQAMGADFSGVKVHTDAQSDQLNQLIQAKAFTTGQDVFFRQGEYNLGSQGGQELIAHELTHVVQQNGGVVQRYFIHGDGDERQTEEQVRDVCVGAGLNEQQTNWVWSNRGSDKQKRRLENWIERAPNNNNEDNEGTKEERGTKRSKQEEEDSTESIEVESTLDEMMEELKQRKKVKSYAGDVQIHKIQKGQPELACFNWALRGLSDTGGPLPDDFWNVLQGAPGANQEWMTSLDQKISEAIVALTQKIADNQLGFDDYLKTLTYRNEEGGFRNPQKQNKARQLMIEACQLIVKSNGMTPVDDNMAEAWVVCQYKKVMGAASPEHWWIELPGGQVIQTVPGHPLEIGGKETVWHSEGGRDEMSAHEYEQIKIGVQGLLQRHKDVIRQGIDKMAFGRRKK